jgi:ABC-2 type transport system ATP-binding protein
MQMPSAIRFDNLSKTFGRGRNSTSAVRQLNLEIQAGQVYGFLGPNGAGKTTTIRMIMALIHPTHGKVFVYGQEVQRHPAALRRVGALVEGAAFYGYLTARENLEVLAHTMQAHDSQRITTLLEQVGLDPNLPRKVSHYSMGMKQRLGIAAALLGNPDLVILDEPTNGLDPAGIQEMRAYIRSLASEQGRTVFLSSHLLHEVEQICDRVAIFHKGQLIREGTVTELVAGKVKLRLQVSPADQAGEVLQERWEVTKDNEWLTLNAQPDESPAIVKHLVTQDIQVYQVVVERQSLEEYFMTVTQA